MKIFSLVNFSTIVKRLINGSGAVPAIPVVWGISATVERFNEAMNGAEGRSTLPNVVVDSAKVLMVLHVVRNGVIVLVPCAMP